MAKTMRFLTKIQNVSIYNLGSKIFSNFRFWIAKFETTFLNRQVWNKISGPPSLKFFSIRQTLNPFLDRQHLQKKFDRPGRQNPSFWPGIPTKIVFNRQTLKIFLDTQIRKNFGLLSPGENIFGQPNLKKIGQSSLKTFFGQWKFEKIGPSNTKTFLNRQIQKTIWNSVTRVKSLFEPPSLKNHFGAKLGIQ